MTRDELKEKVGKSLGVKKRCRCVRCKHTREVCAGIMSLFDKCLEELPRARTVRRSNCWDWEK